MEFSMETKLRLSTYSLHVRSRQPISNYKRGEVTELLSLYPVIYRTWNLFSGKLLIKKKYIKKRHQLSALRSSNPIKAKICGCVRASFSLSWLNFRR